MIAAYLNVAAIIAALVVAFLLTGLITGFYGPVYVQDRFCNDYRNGVFTDTFNRYYYPYSGYNYNYYNNSYYYVITVLIMIATLKLFARDNDHSFSILHLSS